MKMTRMILEKPFPFQNLKPQKVFFLFFAFAGLFLPTFTAQAQTVTYTYDSGANGIGRLSSVTDPTGSEAFSYDVRGNITKTVKVIEGNSFTTQSAYDSLNRVKKTTYPDNEAVSYGYDEAGNLKSVGSYVTSITYNALNQRATMALGNGTSTTYSYDPNSFRLSQLATTGPASVTLQNLGYTYDYAGNVLTISDGVVSTNGQTLTYDPLNRPQLFLSRERRRQPPPARRHHRRGEQLYV